MKSPLMQFWFGHYGEAARVESFKIFLLHPNTASYYTLHQTMLGDAIVTTRGQRMLYKVQIIEYNHLENVSYHFLLQCHQRRNRRK